MRVDLDGLGAKIKAAISGPDADDLRYMVDQLIDEIRHKEDEARQAVIDAEREAGTEAYREGRHDERQEWEGRHGW